MVIETGDFPLATREVDIDTLLTAPVAAAASVVEAEAAATLAEGFAALAETAADNAQASSRTCATWTELSTLTGTVAGEGAEVLDADAGTHTDPVIGGTVANAGRYTWSASPAGWKWISVTGLAGKAEKTTVNISATEQDLTLTDNIGNIAARMGVAGARGKAWAASVARLKGGGVDITPTSDHGLIIADGLGFYVNVPTTVGLLASVATVIAALDIPPVPLVTDGRGVFWSRGKLAGIAVGATSAACKIAMTGDSYTERARITAHLSSLLYTEYSQGADGFLAAGQTGGELNAVAHTYSGMTLHDISAERGSPAGPYGPAGSWLEATGTAGVAAWAGVRAATLHLYYEDTTGTFRYRVDGGSWVVVAGGGTNAPAKVTVSGLPIGSTHQIDIDTAGNAGTVKLSGLYATGMDGVEFSKIGNASSTAGDMAVLVDGAMRTFILADLAPDAVVIQFGGNDVLTNVVPATYQANIAALVADYQAANPKCGAVLAPSYDLGATATYDISEYTAACAAVAAATDQCEFLNTLELMGPYAKTYPEFWEDTTHPNDTGGRMYAGFVFRNFFLI